MPTNLYGPNDNFNLETSHVVPALIRKFHLGRCLEQDDWESIKKDLDARPIEGIDGNSSNSAILAILKKYGISKDNGHTSIILWGTGKPRREFMHVNDMAEACLHIMENVEAKNLYDKMKETHINIGLGSDIEIGEAAALIRQLTGFDGEVEYDSSKPDGTPRKLMDVSLLNELGYKAKTDPGKGFELAYEWYLS
jgi:GDP-L-fucose synthase